jgi:hypothetical protein
MRTACPGAGEWHWAGIFTSVLSKRGKSARGNVLRKKIKIAIDKINA